MFWKVTISKRNSEEYVKGEPRDIEAARNVMFSMRESQYGFEGVCLAEKLDPLAGCDVESLKLAKVGKNVFRNALVMDLIRRFVYLLGAGVIAYVKLRMFSLLLTAMAGYIALIIVLNVTRYMSTFLLQISMSQVAVALYHLIMLLGSDFDTIDSAGLRGTIMMLLLVVSAALGVATVIHVQGRWKESYYEK